MRAVMYEQFGERPELRDLADPSPEPHGVVIEVGASGVCRSDVHGWGGHDPVIQLPHVPGHELAGTVAAVGAEVRRWSVGDRVTVPFVGGCGSCHQCHAGQQQVCDTQFQPGFTHWGSFAQLVRIDQADLNLVGLPEAMSFSTAASLGCRFVTSYRALVDQSGMQPGQWLAVHGCGGIGLSAIMIGRAMGARIIGVDVRNESLTMATSLGAEHVVDASSSDVVGAIHELTSGGAHVSIDALGIPETCTNSVRSLRKRGRHVQLGWMLGADATPPIPMDLVMGWELEIVGSHGMQAHRYGDMLDQIERGHLNPDALVQREISLAESIDVLTRFDELGGQGITVITDFS